MFDRTDAPVRAMARVPSGESLRPEMQSLRPGGRPGPGGSFRDRYARGPGAGGGGAGGGVWRQEVGREGGAYHSAGLAA